MKVSGLAQLKILFIVESSSTDVESFFNHNMKQQEYLMEKCII